jgi:TRAP-type C4-dicarboxylate transport system substrate-binding protein
MSRRTFEALSAADRDVVVAAAAASVPVMRELWDKMEAESRDFVVKAGVKVNDVDREAFHRAAQPIVEATLRDASLRKLYENIRAAA